MDAFSLANGMPVIKATGFKGETRQRLRLHLTLSSLLAYVLRTPLHDMLHFDGCPVVPSNPIRPVMATKDGVVLPLNDVPDTRSKSNTLDMHHGVASSPCAADERVSCATGVTIFFAETTRHYFGHVDRQ